MVAVTPGYKLEDTDAFADAPGEGRVAARGRADVAYTPGAAAQCERR